MQFEEVHKSNSEQDKQKTMQVAASEQIKPINDEHEAIATAIWQNK